MSASASTPPPPLRISPLGFAPGPPDRAHHREPVELTVGQRERAGVTERVLGRDEEERVGQRVGDAVDRDLVLFHRLEQRGLGARRGPVHLVDEQDVREHRPGAELPLAGRRAVHRRAGDVGRQQVGRALHPPEAAADRVGQRLGEQGLAGTGHALDEEVPARQQRDDRERRRRRRRPASTGRPRGTRRPPRFSGRAADRRAGSATAYRRQG